MKKRYIFLLLIVSCAWMIWRSNYYAANFRTEQFYEPIFSSGFDVSRKGATIQTKLVKNFDVIHGFFLVFPCDTPNSKPFENLDGLIEYKLFSNNNVIVHKQISPPARPLFGFNQKQCDLLLFPIEFPNSFWDSELILEVTIISPITQLNNIRNKIKCEVSPALWPK